MSNKSNSLKMYLLLIVSIFVIIIGLKVVKAPTPIILLVGGGITSAIAVALGTKWEEIQKAIFESINSMIIGILLLMVIGILISSWILSGVVPMLVYYGLKLIAPSIFLVLTCIICSLMSVFTGTSWGTIGTVGVALVGVSQGFGIPLPYTVGAIITGALFGDKLSPLSDTTIMAPTLSNVDILDHIKHMLYTTVPGYVISLVLYIILGLNLNATGTVSGEKTTLILNTLKESFNLNPLLLLIPILVLFLIFKKIPSLPVFAIGIFLGCFFAIVLQGASLSEIANTLYGGFKSATDIEIVDKMLSRGGLTSMLSSIALVLSAAVFGGPLKAAGVLQFMVSNLNSSTKNWKIIMAGSYFLNLIVVLILASYYALFTLMGPIMKPLYDRYGIPRKNLSRMLEDIGTAPAWITPWNACAIFAVSTLGVPVSEYALYAPMTYLGIVFAMIYIYTGFGIGKVQSQEISLDLGGERI